MVVAVVLFVLGRHRDCPCGACLTALHHPEVTNVEPQVPDSQAGDHVGVAVADIQAGEHVQGVFMDDDSTIEIDAHDAVPLGHKIAIADLVGERA